MATVIANIAIPVNTTSWIIKENCGSHQVKEHTVVGLLFVRRSFWQIYLHDVVNGGE